MVDRYIYGAIDRISPEAPIPIIRIGREETMLGGVGNVARNVGAAGGRAQLLAIHGEDDAGDDIADLQDNCPRASNSSQVDSDGDTLGDACDEDDDGDGLVETGHKPRYGKLIE